MIKKIQNMDPMTKSFAKACAFHIATVAAMCAVTVYYAKKNS